MDYYYTNFVQAKYYNPQMNEWRMGLIHHEEILDYKGGFVVRLDNFNDDWIIE